MSRRRHFISHRTSTMWNVVIKDAGIPLPGKHRIPLPGYIVRLEHGPNYVGPSQMIPKVLDWWWRPTVVKALAKGFREARR